MHRSAPAAGPHCAVDIGGTFTDLVLWDPTRGGLTVAKSLTTHTRPLAAMLACIDQAGVPVADLSLFKHGTTLVINTLLEQSGARVALVTTKGFKDVIAFGRGSRVGATDLRFARAEPMVDPQLRFELDERIDAHGTVLRVPEAQELAALADALRSSGAEAVAISFLNAYRFPEHERLVSDHLRQLPGVFVTTGSELSQEWHEFERTATAVANAYVGTKVAGHVGELSDELDRGGFTGQLLLMGSSGGVLAPEAVRSAPILLVESGPVGGCIGAAAMGARLGFDNVIAFDMGGTTAKCAVAKSGAFDVETTYHVGGYGTGTPVRVPVVDIVEVGAGGGSIAWANPQGQLKVGPRSAGSSPGPACYGLGGTEPTITDAHVFLGRLDPANFQGGDMPLDLEASRAALAALGHRLGFSGEEGLSRLAAGILSIAGLTMSGAVRRVTVERGEDPRDYVMFAYGGAGPLQAVDLARELSIPLVVVPPVAGNFSALGMLLAEVRYDQDRTFLHRLDDDGVSSAISAAESMQVAMRDTADRDFPGADVRFELSADARFDGQYSASRVVIGDGDRAADVADRFRKNYGTRFGHVSPDSDIELVSLRLTAFVATERPELDHLLGDAVGQADPPVRTRPVFYPVEGVALEAAVYQREALPIGFRGQGPAVLEERDCTTVIGAGDTFEMGMLGEIRIAVGPMKGAIG